MKNLFQFFVLSLYLLSLDCQSQQIKITKNSFGNKYLKEVFIKKGQYYVDRQNGHGGVSTQKPLHNSIIFKERNNHLEIYYNDSLGISKEKEINKFNNLKNKPLNNQFNRRKSKDKDQILTWKANSCANTSTSLCGHYVTCLNFDKENESWFGTYWAGVSKLSGGNWTNYSVPEGLPDMQINCITPDNDGNIWIGTWSGLVKFDGNNCKTYTRENTNNQFEGEWVFSIIIDKNGVKWLGTVWGVYKFDDLAFVRYFLNPNDNGLITTMVADSSFNLWIGTDHGKLYKFNGENYILYDSISSVLGDSIPIMSIVIDDQQNKWISTNGKGIFKFDSTNWINYTTNDGLVSNNVTSIAIDSAGNKWISTWGAGVNCFNDTTWRLYNSSNSGLKMDYVFCSSVDRSGNKWFGTFDGLSKFDGNSWLNIQSNGLKDNVINQIEVDSENNKWFTSDYGFSELNGSNWTNFSVDNGLLGKISNGWSFAIDSVGNKWFGNCYGVSEYNGSTWTYYNTHNSPLTDSLIRQIKVDRYNNLWFGTQQGGLFKFDGQHWGHYLTGYRVNAIVFGNQNNDVWVGTSLGLYRINGNNVTSFISPFDNNIHALAIDIYGAVWVGTDDDISKFDGTTWTHYQNPYLQNSSVNTIEIDNDGNKWIGTWDGAYVFDDYEWTAYNYSSSAGLYNGFFNLKTAGSNLVIFSIKKDKSGDIWFGTINGISKLSKNDSVIFTVSPAINNVNAPIGFANFYVKSNVAWNDTCEAEWCTFVQNGHGGNTPIVALYDTNASGLPRIANINIKIDGMDSLRHVQLIQSQYINIIAIVNPPNAGTVMGAGLEPYGSWLTLSARPKAGYVFYKWVWKSGFETYDSVFMTPANEYATPIEVYFKPVSGLEELEHDSPISIYPNPASISINLLMKTPENLKARVTIYNLLGYKLSSFYNIQKIDVSDLKEGYYILDIEINNNHYMKKLLISRE